MMTTTTAYIGSVKLDPKIEAYGVKGLKSKAWRKVFANADALNRWLDRNDAECYGVREV